MNTEPPPDSELRRMVAEALGWKCAKRVPEELKHLATSCWIRPGNYEWQEEQLPDYPNDLNAIHSAIISRSLTFQDNVITTLKQMLHYEREVVYATARQLCIAFLKTLGKIL